jgi:hypothetical protein
MLHLVFAALVSLTPEQQVVVVAEAKKALGVPCDLGGRLQRGRGLDCQGLIFFALQPVSRCGWRSWSVMPTVSVQGELGLPVPGWSPLAAADVASKMALLEPGDILWFLGPDENSAEPSMTLLNGAPHWVWHTGLYVGGGRFIVGDHFAGAVVEEELEPYVRAHYAGVFVTRMAHGPLPTGRCRSHAAMVFNQR